MIFNNGFVTLWMGDLRKQQYSIAGMQSGEVGVTYVDPDEAARAYGQACENLSLFLRAASAWYRERFQKLQETYADMSDISTINEEEDSQPFDLTVPIQHPTTGQVCYIPVNQNTVQRVLDVDGFDMDVSVITEEGVQNLNVQKAAVFDALCEVSDAMAYKSVVFEHLSELKPEQVVNVTEVKSRLTSLIGEAGASASMFSNSSALIGKTVVSSLQAMLDLSTPTENLGPVYSWDEYDNDGNIYLTALEAIKDDLVDAWNSADVDLSDLGNLFRNIGTALTNVMMYIATKAFPDIEIDYVLKDDASNNICDMPFASFNLSSASAAAETLSGALFNVPAIRGNSMTPAFSTITLDSAGAINIPLGFSRRVFIRDIFLDCLNNMTDPGSVVFTASGIRFKLYKMGGRFSLYCYYSADEVVLQGNIATPQGIGESSSFVVRENTNRGFRDAIVAGVNSAGDGALSLSDDTFSARFRPRIRSTYWVMPSDESNNVCWVDSMPAPVLPWTSEIEGQWTADALYALAWRDVVYDGAYFAGLSSRLTHTDVFLATPAMSLLMGLIIERAIPFWQLCFDEYSYVPLDWRTFDNDRAFLIPLTDGPYYYTPSEYPTINETILAYRPKWSHESALRDQFPPLLYNDDDLTTAQVHVQTVSERVSEIKRVVYSTLGAIVSAFTAVMAVKVKRRLKRKVARRKAELEAARFNAALDPSPANAKALSKAQKRADRAQRLYGGGTNSNPSSDDNSGFDFDDLSCKVNQIFTSLTGEAIE